MLITNSARRHGIDDDDMLHATRNVIGTWELGDGRVMFVGPSRSGALLEIGTNPTEDGLIVFHAMSCRSRYLPR